MKTYVVTPLNHLSETVLMRIQNIYFIEKYRKLFLKYPYYPFLSRALDKYQIFRLVVGGAST